MAPKRKGPKTKGKPIVRNRIENRDNYKRWPWTSFLVLGISTGSIFFMAGSPGEISETNGMPFYLSLIFLILGSVMLIPSVLVVLILFWYCFLNAIGTRVPEKCQCLYWFAMKNKKVSQSINFYNYKAKEPSVWTIEGQMKQLKNTNPASIEATALEYQTSIEFNNNEEEIEVITEQVRPSGGNISGDDDASDLPNHKSIYDNTSSVFSTPPPIRIKVPFESYTVHSSHAYSPEEDEIVEIHTPNRMKKKYMSRKNSDGWEERLIDETSFVNTRPNKSNKEKLKYFPSDMDSLSNYSDRNSVLTGKSDIPLVQIHPPSGNNNNTRTTNRGYRNRNFSYNNLDFDGDRFFDGRNQRNMGSDRRNKRYNESEKVHTESDKGYNSDKLSVSSYQGSYLSPVIRRPQHTYNKQNIHVHRTRSPTRMDDVVLATQKQYPVGKRKPRGRTRPRYNRFNQGKREPPPGTTADKTVFPEKITLNLTGFSNPKPKKSGRNGTVVINFDSSVPKWKRNGHKPLSGIHEYDNEVFVDDNDDDDVCSSSSSWIGIPWHSYKLPAGFQNPNAEDELSV